MTHYELSYGYGPEEQKGYLGFRPAPDPKVMAHLFNRLSELHEGCAMAFRKSGLEVTFAPADLPEAEIAYLDAEFVLMRLGHSATQGAEMQHLEAGEFLLSDEPDQGQSETHRKIA